MALAPEWLARYGDLAGVALDAEVSCNGGTFRENLLFTHRGLSGPAILQISSYWREGQEIVIDLLPDADAAAFLKDRKRSRPKAELRTVLAELMPQRLAAHLATDGAQCGKLGQVEAVRQAHRTPAAAEERRETFGGAPPSPVWIEDAIDGERLG